jgi:hypothetical protein
MNIQEPDQSVRADSDSEGAQVAQEPANGKGRDAIIILGGLRMEEAGKFVDDAARRIAAAFDDEAVTGSATFVVEEGMDEDYGRNKSEYKTRKITVIRKDNTEEASTNPIVDIYGLDYRDTLIGKQQDQSPLVRFLSTFGVLLSNSSRLLFSVRQKSKSSEEKWQVRFALLLYFFLFLYLFVIIGALANTFLQNDAAPDASATAQLTEIKTGGGKSSLPEVTTPRTGTASSADPNVSQDSDTKNKASATKHSDQIEPTDNIQKATLQIEGMVSKISNNLGPYTEIFQLIVVWLTAIGLFFKFDPKAWIEKTGVEIIAANNYLSYGNRREALRDQFGALLNHLEEKKETNYSSVHVIGYSFGSVIVLDSLFPENSEPGPRFQRIKKIVTIGCPFDFIRTYWIDYFEKRASIEGFPHGWLNIYAPADILSSDFKDVDSEGVAPDRGVGIKSGGVKIPDNFLYGHSKPLSEYGWVERLMLIGFKHHDRYWENGSAGCFREVVRELYKGHAALK